MSVEATEPSERVTTDTAVACALELLSRGWLKASLMTLAAVASSGCLLGLAVVVARLLYATSVAWVPVGLLCACFICLGPLSVYAAPLATLVAAARGEERFGVASTLSAVPKVSSGFYLVLGTYAGLFVASALPISVVFSSPDCPFALKLVSGAGAFVFAAIGTWIHGTMLIGSARVLLGQGHVRSSAGEHPMQSLLVGGGPVIISGAFIGGFVARHFGILAGTSVPELGLIAASVVALLGAHIVSCALAVALASPSDPQRDA